jgi:dipeptidyl aminopeptidase/acylaminoacyl peptidase
MPSLSPDGSQLLISYWDFSTEMPAEWLNSAYMKHRATSGEIQAARLLILYNLKTNESSSPLKTPFVFSPPVWSLGGRSFLVATDAEVGSQSEEQETRDGSLGQPKGALLYFISLGSKQPTIVSSHLAFPWEGPLSVGKDGSILARVGRLNTISRFIERNGKWEKEETSTIPLQLADAVAASERYVIGAFGDLTTPPELFEYGLDQQKIEGLEKLNPQFDHLQLASPVDFQWKTPEGFNASGIMLLPPGYQEGHRYPLVIHTKPFSAGFVCSFGNYPSFAPQPIADAGILYLGPGSLRAGTAAEPEQNVEDYLPTGYPPGISEAAFNVDVWDSAVKKLSGMGMVDESRVGIIGFSRTGWITEFILVHSNIHYRAATVADNVQYSYGEYWLSPDLGKMKSYDNIYGGPPYGATLKNWLDYSVSFNLDKIHTPLLMEEMGYGISGNVNPMAPPITLASSSEVFSGLNRLHKPVELYFYPNEEHTPEHPQARLATMQRNVDWYRFWLQGYERPDPEDKFQYARWEKMRQVQDLADKHPNGSSDATPASKQEE